MVLGELPVLGEFAVQLAGSAPTVQVVHLVRAQPVLGESAVRLAGSASTEQVVHLVRAQPVLRVQRVCLVLLVPRRTGWRKWGRRQAGLHWHPRTFGGAPG